jgi:hypothetical protein
MPPAVHPDQDLMQGPKISGMDGMGFQDHAAGSYYTPAQGTPALKDTAGYRGALAAVLGVRIIQSAAELDARVIDVSKGNASSVAIPEREQFLLRLHQCCGREPRAVRT